MNLTEEWKEVKTKIQIFQILVTACNRKLRNYIIMKDVSEV